MTTKFGANAVARDGVHMTSEERAQRSLDGTLPAHIPPLSTAKLDAVSRARCRRAWAELQQGNIESVELWLHQVAAGTPDRIDEATGARIQGTNPNPRAAIELFIEMAKFTTPQVKAVAIEMTDSKGTHRMTVTELEALANGDGS